MPWIDKHNEWRLNCDPLLCIFHCLIQAPISATRHNSNVCGQIILTVVHDYVLKHTVDESLLRLIRHAVRLLCESLEWLQVASIKQTFCLNCIVACCAKMQPIEYRNYLHLIQSWAEIILETGCIYYRCSTEKGKLQLQMDMNKCPVKQAQRYTHESI